MSALSMASSYEEEKQELIKQQKEDLKSCNYTIAEIECKESVNSAYNLRFLLLELKYIFNS